MLLLILYHLVLVITTIKSITIFRKKSENNFCIYLLITVLVEIVAIILQDVINFKNVDFIYKLYGLFHIVFFGYYFLKDFTGYMQIFTKAIMTLSLVLILFFCNFSDDVLNENIITIIGFFSLLLSLGWFFQKLNSPNEKKISDDPLFWIATGLLLWSVFFILRQLPRFFFIERDEEFSQIMRTFFYLVNIITYSLYYISLKTYDKLNYE